MRTQTPLKELADQDSRIAEWLNENKQSFYNALGLRPFDDKAMVLALAGLRKYFGGHFPMFKDPMDRSRCETIMAFLHGEEFDADELRMAVVLMLQAYNAACDRALKPPPMPPRPYIGPRPGPRPPYKIGSPVR